MIAPGKTEKRLPKGWRWAKLGEVCEIVAGQSPPGSTYRNTPQGLPFFQGKADFGDLYPVARVWCVEPNKVAEEGDILVSVRAPVGPTNVADCQCCIGRGLAAIRCSNEVDSGFILAALRRFEAALSSKGSGSTFEAISRSDLEALEIPLPPLPEQKRIAAILNEHMAAVERARKAAEERLAAVNDLPSAYLRAVFLAPDQPLPEGWRWVRLGQVLRQRKEVIHPRDKPYGPAIFVGLEHIESNIGRRTGAENVETSELTGRKPRFYAGDIVYGYLRPYLNKVWLAEFNGLCSVDQYVFSAQEDLACAAYVSWFMRSPSYLDNSPVGNTPGWLPRIRTEEVSAVSLPLPPLPEQKRIAAMLNEQMAVVQRACKAAEEEQATINALPAALLRRAFAGEL